MMRFSHRLPRNAPFLFLNETADDATVVPTGSTLPEENGTSIHAERPRITDCSDWATNCPKYRATAVQASPSNGPTDRQEDHRELTESSRPIVPEAAE